MAWQYILIGIFLLAAVAFLFVYLDARKKSKQSDLAIYDLNMRNKCYKQLLEQDGFTVEQLREIRWILMDDLKKVNFEKEDEKTSRKPRNETQVINYFYKRQDINGLINFAVARYTENKPDFIEKFETSVKYLADNKIDYQQIRKERT